MSTSGWHRWLLVAAAIVIGVAGSIIFLAVLLPLLTGLSGEQD
jgi:hypothetical protein